MATLNNMCNALKLPHNFLSFYMLLLGFKAMYYVKNYLAQLCAKILTGYIKICFITSTVKWSDNAQATYQKYWNSRQLICYQFFHDEFLMTCLLGYTPEISSPLIVCNDTFAGLVVRYFWLEMHCQSTVLGVNNSRKKNLLKLNQAAEQEENLVMAADYGRPWYKVHFTGAMICNTFQGLLVGMHIQAARL